MGRCRRWGRDSRLCSSLTSSLILGYLDNDTGERTTVVFQPAAVYRFLLKASAFYPKGISNLESWKQRCSNELNALQYSKSTWHLCCIIHIKTRSLRTMYTESSNKKQVKIELPCTKPGVLTFWIWALPQSFINEITSNLTFPTFLEAHDRLTNQGQGTMPGWCWRLARSLYLLYSGVRSYMYVYGCFQK